MANVREGFRRLGTVLHWGAVVGWLLYVAFIALDEEAWEAGSQELLALATVLIGGAALVWGAGWVLGRIIDWIWDGFAERAEGNAQ